MRLKIALWMAVGLAAYSDSAVHSEESAVPERGEIPHAAISGASGRSPVLRRGKWLYQKTQNFRIWASGSESQLSRLSAACEDMRTHLRSAWLGQDDDTAWIPPCDVVVHATVADYVGQLGAGSEQTSGCSSIELDSGRVVVRRIDLRADAAAWLTDSLPHELTHVVLADRFSTRQISHWADEGMAILAEPLSKQSLRARDFKAALSSRGPIRTADLLALNQHLPAQYRAAFYGQSTSLVKFLVDRGTPAQFVDFIERSMAHGHDRALRDIYRIHGVADLDRLWRAAAAGADKSSKSAAFSRRVAEIVAPRNVAMNP